MHGMQMPQQQQQQQQQQAPAPFCGVPGSELAAMAQAAWGQMDGAMQPMHHHPPAGLPDPGRHPGIPEQPQVSLSAQAELELELSLRGSLLVQQQRRIVQLEDELQRAWTEIDRLRTKISSVERERQRSDDDGAKQPRYWTPEEHRLFMEAVQRYGWKDVKSIAQAVGTRTPTQVRTHAQKLFLRQQKESTGAMNPGKGGKDLDSLPMPDHLEEGGTMQGLQEAAYLAQMQEAGGVSDMHKQYALSDFDGDRSGGHSLPQGFADHAGLMGGGGGYGPSDQLYGGPLGGDVKSEPPL